MKDTQICNSDTGFDNCSVNYEDDFEVSNTMQLFFWSNSQVLKQWLTLLTTIKIIGCYIVFTYSLLVTVAISW